MKQLAIIGSTASGKSDLALSLAHKHNAIILSIDSLSIYREIDIASAKPSKEELASVYHFGIDVLKPDVNATVFTFIDEYHRAVSYAHAHSKNLIIVGGSSFYLKSMVDGLSYVPPITDETKENASVMLHNLFDTYQFLADIDPISMDKITPTDAYRIEKMLHLYLQTSTPPSLWFKEHPPQPIIHECPILNIESERSYLRERIGLRTHKMVCNDLIDEVAELERLYGRIPNSMKAIGIIETLEFLDGKITKNQLIEDISTHTAQLAKRQQTFNAHQFKEVINGSVKELYDRATITLMHP
ncbi:MAG: tRNA (adenosine(37)-N6)-dimethylallyltransferase MiaA [Sulfuricurvum sp.]|uniref:tRNA (adenosine(37)-N6)-dimethylallyltransferase MiaA n=1 Tax=Sulfuricurvum sp. TaxID=2025608 RepID=UPI002630AACE|nr:tRNA (adenosine(37)-N6)-dimethylallyltransferase MiaA [Sulfuricurvum sp.]MDD2828237.1 tRNA (adenosine(37)-N6)-dimethylallyltransferase MiaA [Sulfuricurvum sp.]MDD4949808.1 tRNA (adenosine(37)-N6)-dimethylallyltransferase MiaA [Sulfuricurvum sp.]